MTKAVCSIEAEEGVLGCILSDGKLFHETSELTENMFHSSVNRKIYNVMVALNERKEPIDILTVSTALEDNGSLDDVGGNSKLISLAEGVFTTYNIAKYAKTVKEKWLMRNVIRAGSIMEKLGEDEEKTIDEVFTSVSEVMEKVKRLHSPKVANTLADDVEAYQAYLEERRGKKVFGWSFGEEFAFLNNVTDGIQRKKTYRIGANSNVGKTQFAYSIITNTLKQGAKVLFLTLENERETTINYLLANLQGVNSRHLTRGQASPDLNLLFPFKDSLIIVDGETNLDRLLAIAEKVKPDIVILDYIGLIRIKGATTESKFAEYAERIPQFAKDNNLSWIDLSNLPKNSDSDTLRLYGEFFGASSLKNNLDVGIHFVYNEEYREWKKSFDASKFPEVHNKQVVQMMITKNRLGPTGIEQTFIIEFNKGGRMREATEAEVEGWSV